jgi:DNA-binding winged helix-turn-helix (wHTH) protein
VLRGGVPVPLIPRYFDLLVLLIERRQAVVTRRDIFDAVWGDVFVSDGALTQAIRTLRRALGDDPRDPVYIRTVSRHGYSFIHIGVVEDQGDSPPLHSETVPVPNPEALVARLMGQTTEGQDLEDRREAAQQLHSLGAADAVAQVMAAPGHAEALALLRDTRWDVPGSASVPLLGQPEGLSAARLLIVWRLRDALRLTARRWAQAAGGAAAAGALAGLVGGALLVLAPGSTTTLPAVTVLMLLGAIAGGAGATGVAAGMAGAEVVSRSRRTAALILGGAAGGCLVGAALNLVVGWTLVSLFGVMLALGGALEGLVIGGAVATGYALATARIAGEIPAPQGARRGWVVTACGFSGAMAAMALVAAGRLLVGGIVHEVAQAFQGSQVSLAPLGAWLGEPVFGPVTRLLVAALEGGLFGAGLAFGLTKR